MRSHKNSRNTPYAIRFGMLYKIGLSKLRICGYKLSTCFRLFFPKHESSCRSTKKTVANTKICEIPPVLRVRAFYSGSQISSRAVHMLWKPVSWLFRLRSHCMRRLCLENLFDKLLRTCQTGIICSSGRAPVHPMRLQVQLAGPVWVDTALSFSFRVESELPSSIQANYRFSECSMEITSDYHGSDPCPNCTSTITPATSFCS